VIGPPPRVLSYGEGETLLAYGPAEGPQLVLLQPLFEEMNRCRALVARLCRYLSARGYGCWLPDLPGCGESRRALESVGWQDWTDAVDDVLAIVARDSGSPAVGSVAIRGGCLLDAPSPRRWRLSPVPGASLLTDLRRARLLAGGAYQLSDTFAASLQGAEPGAGARVLRLDGDDRPCDRHLPGPPLWRRPEPEDSPELAEWLAEDIDAWASA
jgi:hypothetical protein